MGVFKDRSRETMLILYKSLIRPKLEYCSPLWSPVKVGEVELVEEVQRKFTRWINSCAGMTYWQRLQHLQIQSLQRRRERFLIIEVWKVYRGLTPNTTNIRFTVHPRLGVKAELPSLNLYKRAQAVFRSLLEDSFGVRALQLFNKVPQEIIANTTLPSLKVHLGEWLSKIPDRPPVKGVPRIGDNSLLCSI